MARSTPGSRENDYGSRHDAVLDQRADPHPDGIGQLATRGAMPTTEPVPGTDESVLQELPQSAQRGSVSVEATPTQPDLLGSLPPRSRDLVLLIFGGTAGTLISQNVTSKPLSGRERDETIRTIVRAYRNHPFVRRGLELFRRPVPEIEAPLSDIPPARRYINDISQYGLLSSDEEASLFTLIDRCLHVCKGLEGVMHPELFQDRALILLTVAYQALWVTNMPWVTDIARRYAALGTGLELEDLLSAGADGLATAIRQFDSAKSGKLTTYSTIWIRQSITRYIAQKARLIYIPEAIHGHYLRLTKVERSLQQVLNREPTLSEIAAQANLSTDEAQFYLIVGEFGHDSLNAPAGDGEDAEWGDFVSGGDNVDAAAVIADRALVGQYVAAATDLTPHERIAVAIFCGFYAPEAAGIKIDTQFGRMTYAEAYRLLLVPDDPSPAFIGRVLRRTGDEVEEVINSGLLKLRAVASKADLDT